MRDIYKRSYFITKNMQEDTRKKTLVNGMLPLVVWTIAQLDMEILSLDYFFVNASGQKDFFKEYDIKRPPHGVEIKVRKKGSRKERKVI